MWLVLVKFFGLLRKHEQLSPYMARDPKTPNYCAYQGIKSFRIRKFFSPFLPAFDLNTDIYSLNLRIQPICRKMRIRQNSKYVHLSRSVSSKFSSYIILSWWCNFFKDDRKCIWCAASKVITLDCGEINKHLGPANLLLPRYKNKNIQNVSKIWNDSNFWLNWWYTRSHKNFYDEFARLFQL